MPGNHRQLLINISLVFALITATFVHAIAVDIVHRHGLTFYPQGKRLMKPAHFGIVTYVNGEWLKISGSDYDYMGFTVTRNAIYTSEHTAPGSWLPNPFGLNKH